MLNPHTSIYTGFTLSLFASKTTANSIHSFPNRPERQDYYGLSADAMWETEGRDDNSDNEGDDDGDDDDYSDDHFLIIYKPEADPKEGGCCCI